MEEKILISSSEIQEKLQELATKISDKYDSVTLLITLTGDIYTAIDLSKYLKIPCKMEFIKVSSYGSNEFSSGIVEMKYSSIKKDSYLGNTILIDDICDTGRTLKMLVEYIKNNYGYSSLNTLTLLDKPSRREVEVTPNYVGFTIEDKFVYGYGLDLDGYERNLQDIWYKGE